MSTTIRSFASFREFYPFYLGEHANPTCRRLHYLGSTLALICISLAVMRRNPWFVLLGLLCGYGCAWVGHFVFEKNRPATFSNPVYSFAADWVMLFDMLRGKIRF
jgi:hypothetical protein